MIYYNDLWYYVKNGIVISEIESTPAQKSSIVFLNDLSEQYGYYSSRLIAYTKCKVRDIECTIKDDSADKIKISVKLLLEKTYQNEDSSLDNIKFSYKLCRDGVVVKNGSVIVLDAELGLLYEEYLTFWNMQPGDYTLEFKSYYN